MRAAIPRHASAPVSAEVFRRGIGANEELLVPLLDLAERSESIIAGSIGEFNVGKGFFHLPRFVFLGPKGGSDTVRMAIFAALRGTETEGTKAIFSLFEHLEQNPALAVGYHIYAYPICNPSGVEARSRHNAGGVDLTTQFWCGSNQPEAYYLEREMGVHHFQGVVSLGRTEDEQSRFFFNGGRSSILPAALTSTAMPATQIFLAAGTSRSNLSASSAAKQPKSDATAFLTRTDELRPAPFEINFEIPRKAAQQWQIDSMVNALKSILDSYRSVLAIRQNI